MGGMPGAGGARTFHFSTGGSGGFRFNSPDNIFADFFKQGGAGMGDDDDVFAGFGQRMGSGGRGRSYRDSSGAARHHHRAPTPEVTTVERPLPVTLEELYKGTHKKMKIKRKTFDQGTFMRKVEDKILDMEIRPGYKAGTKIKFRGVGDQEEGGTQDLHFIVTEVRLFFTRLVSPCYSGIWLTCMVVKKDHPLFKREDDNLRVTIELDLKEALTGWKRTIATIDGKQMPISGGGPTQPGFKETFPGQGMPKSKKPVERGDLIVEVKVKFPSSLTAAQKAQLKTIL